MLLNFDDLVKKYHFKPKGVIHVGAHFGEEYTTYLSNDIKNIVFVEPCAMAFAELRRRLEFAGHTKLFNMALGDKTETAIMYTGDKTVNQGQSNSLLKPAKHLAIHPDVKFTGEEEVDVDTLDNLELVGEPYDLLVMDCQGYEGKVLLGGRDTIKQINWVYTEVNFDEVYEGCTRVHELDEMLHEFKRVETGKIVGGCWSDAFYIRKSFIS